MLSFVLASALSNVGIIPATHPSYDVCARVLPLSVCFGLLAASMPAAEAADGGEGLTPMLLAFLIGATGTVVGCLVGFVLCTGCGT